AVAHLLIGNIHGYLMAVTCAPAGVAAPVTPSPEQGADFITEILFDGLLTDRSRPCQQPRRPPDAPIPSPPPPPRAPRRRRRRSLCAGAGRLGPRDPGDRRRDAVLQHHPRPRRRLRRGAGAGRHGGAAG